MYPVCGTTKYPAQRKATVFLWKSNALFLTKVCLRVYNRQSAQQRPFYRSRKGDSYGTEVVPKISLWSAVLYDFDR
jgi:hypothetical protein